LAIPRNELKFYIDLPTAYLLERRLQSVLQRDSHTNAQGSYRISSLYFDDPANTSYLDKVNGVGERSKYRIRYYNDSMDYIRLEKKEKIGSRCVKRSVAISLETAKELAGTPLLSTDSGHSLVQEMVQNVRYSGFSPAVFVHYRRAAFLHPVGNVRITLDSELKAAPFVGIFPDLDRPAFPVLPPDRIILEVKYDFVFPPYLADLLSDISKEACAISKYCMCREMIVF